MSLEASRLFRSITEHVNDDEKKAAFALMVNGISRASALQNYQEVLKGSNIVVKVAHDFKYLGKVCKTPFVARESVPSGVLFLEAVARA